MYGRLRGPGGEVRWTRVWIPGQETTDARSHEGDAPYALALVGDELYSAALDDEAACDPDVAEDLGGRGEDVGEDNVAERDGGVQTRRDDAAERPVRCGGSASVL